MDYVNGKNTKQVGCVIERGSNRDPRPSKTKSGEMVCTLPGTWGTGVRNDHIPLMPPEKALSDLDTFTGVPDYGTMLAGYKNEGELRFFPTNTWAGINGGQQGMAGNFNLMSRLAQLANRCDGRNRPPNYKEVTRNGARVRIPDEKGCWFFNLTRGIPTHAAMAEIAGIKLPQLKNIPTATQQFNSILTPEMVANLPGIAMSIGSILPMILNNSSNREKVFKNKKPEVIDAFESISALSQSGSTMNGGGYTTGVKVNQEVFTENAVDMLSRCDSVADILNCLTDLSTNPKYFGNGEEDLILTLDETGKGNFKKFEIVYQFKTETTGTGSKSITKIALGKVLDWNSEQKILELSNVNRDEFNSELPVSNEDKTVEYNITEYQYFATSTATKIQGQDVYGNAEIEVDSYGNIRERKSNQKYKAEKDFLSLLSSFASFPSAIQGTNLFGNSSGVMMDMIKRMPPDASQAILKVLQSHYTMDSPIGRTQNITQKGGNAFSSQNFGPMAITGIATALNIIQNLSRR